MEFIKSKLTSISVVLATGVWLFISQSFVETLASRYSSEQLSQAILTVGGITTVLLVWLLFVAYKSSKKEPLSKYTEYQPYPGVTVYVLKENSKNENYSIWHCPHCLLQNGKRGLMQLKPSSGIAACSSCSLKIEFLYSGNA